jgi:hypothetical protein
MARGLSPEEIRDALLCKPCLEDAVIRRAWTMSNGNATCLLHAELRDVEDDMDQHNLYVEIYEKLRQLGFGDAF